MKTTLRKKVSAFLAVLLVISTMLGSMPVTASAKSSAMKVGSTFTSGQLKYKVTALKGKSGNVSVIGAKSKSVASVTIPDTVKKGKYKFSVTAIADKAFKGYKKLKVVNTNKNLKTIGKNAFDGCGKLGKINIKGSKLKSVGKNALKGISKKAVIQVPKSKKKAYAKLLKSKGQKSSVKVTAAGQTQAVETQKPQAAPEVQAPQTEKPQAAAPQAQPTETQKPQVSAPETEAPQQTEAPTEKETEAPTEKETEAPTETPTEKETEAPTEEPSPAPQPEEAKPEHTHELGVEGVDWDLVRIPDSEPTCTTAGHRNCWVCTGCGMEFHSRSYHLANGPLGHDFDYEDAEVVREATCTADGLKIASCRREGCGAQENVILQKTGHEWGEQETIVAATCTGWGLLAQKCQHDGCDALQNRVRVEPLGHFFDESQPYEVRKAATCTSDGVGVRKCAHDGCTLEKEYTIPAAGHSFEKVTVPASCNRAGYTCEKCTACGLEQNKTAIPALSHKFVGEPVRVEPTCTTSGSVSQLCENCGQMIETQFLAPLGHKYGEDGTGNECSVCGHKKAEKAYDYYLWYSTYSMRCGDKTEQLAETLLVRGSVVRNVTAPATFEGHEFSHWEVTAYKTFDRNEETMKKLENVGIELSRGDSLETCDKSLGTGEGYYLFDFVAVYE